MLTGDSYYQPVPNNKRREIFGKIDKFIKSHKNVTKKEVEFQLNLIASLSHSMDCQKYIRVKLSRIFVMNLSLNILKY